MKIFTGKVIANKTEKTATIAVGRTVIHPLYQKRYRKIKKYHVHDEMGTKAGQFVKFVACRPYSKIKKWKIVEIVAPSAKKQEKKARTRKAGKTKK